MSESIHQYFLAASGTRCDDAVMVGLRLDTDDPRRRQSWVMSSQKEKVKKGQPANILTATHTWYAEDLHGIWRSPKGRTYASASSLLIYKNLLRKPKEVRDEYPGFQTRGVWGLDDKNVYVWGQHDTAWGPKPQLSRWTGRAFKDLPKPKGPIHAVRGLAPDRLVAIGPEGHAALFDGASWSTIEGLAEEDFTGAHFITAEELLLVTAQGSIYRGPPEAMVKVASCEHPLHDVVSFQGVIYLAAGKEGGLMRLMDNQPTEFKSHVHATALEAGETLLITCPEVLVSTEDNESFLAAGGGKFGELTDGVPLPGNPSPPELTALGLRFVRDDVLVSALTSAEAQEVSVPEPAPNQAGQPGFSQKVLGLSAANNPIVHGHLTNPLYKKSGGQTPRMSPMMEVDADGVVVCMFDGCRAERVDAVGERFLVATEASSFALYERIGAFGYRTHEKTDHKKNTTVVGRTIFRSNGRNHDDIDVWRVDGRRLRLLGTVPLPMPVLVQSGATLIAGDPERGVAYRVQGLETLAGTDATAVGTTGCTGKRMMQPFLTAPGADLGEVSAGFFCVGSPEGHAVLLRPLGGGLHDFTVATAQGPQPSEPPIAGQLGVAFGLDGSVLCIDGKSGGAWRVDLSTRAATELATLPLGLSQRCGVKNGGVAWLDAGQLHVAGIDEQGQRSVHTVDVGDGASLVESIHGMQVLALVAKGSPLVLIGVLDDGPRLLAAIDPNGPLGTVRRERYELGARLYEVRLWRDKEQLALVGLQAALEAALGTEVLTQLPEAPWTVAPLG